MSARALSRLEARRERILEEAKRLFLSKGYASTSVNEIVRASGGSLATLYREFGSKEALFAEIMRRRVPVLYGSHEPQCIEHKSGREALLALARHLLERVLEREGLALYRMAISEGPRFPELRKVVLEETFPLFIRSIGRALVQLRIGTPSNCTALAEEFLSLVHGQIVFRAACTGRPTISRAGLTQHIEHAVDRFLALHPIRDRRASR